MIDLDTMPIPVDELEKKQRPVEERIQELLERNAGVAYSFTEIVAELEGYNDVSTLSIALTLMHASKRQEIIRPYEVALGKLLGGGSVRSAKHQGQQYFAAAKR